MQEVYVTTWSRIHVIRLSSSIRSILIGVSLLLDPGKHIRCQPSKQGDMLKDSLLLILTSILIRLQLGSQLVQLSLNLVAREPAEARGRDSLLGLTETVQQ